MTTLKVIGFILLGFILILAILAMIAPHQIKVRSEIIIKAPKTKVIEQVRFFKKYPTWSPWLDTDPQQKNEVKGTDGEVGVQFHWLGVKEKGKGYQELTQLTDNQILIKCHIEEPFQSEPDFAYTFSETNDGTRVVYDFKTTMPIPVNIIGMVMGLKNNIQTVNNRGLANLKKVCENTSISQ